MKKPQKKPPTIKTKTTKPPVEKFDLESVNLEEEDTYTDTEEDFQDEPRPTPIPTTRANSTVVERQMSEENASNIKAWLEGLDANRQDLVVNLYRKRPRVWGPKQTNIEGKIETFEEFIDEDLIKESYGGGTYLLQVQKRDAQGRPKYFATRTIKIPGNPIVAELESYKKEESHKKEDESHNNIVVKAFDTLKEQINNYKRDGAMDSGLLQAIQAPMLSQIQALNESNRQLQQQLSAKEDRVLEVLNRPKDNSDRELLTKVWESESTRLESLRQQHLSEIRMKEDSFRDQVTRLRDSHREDLKDRDRAHQREMDNYRTLIETQNESLKTSYNMQLETVKSEKTRLEREITKLETELTTLRAKKEKTLVEQAQELNTVKEQFKSLGLVKGDEESSDNRSLMEKVGGMLADNPEILSTILGNGQPMPMQTAQPMPNPPQPQLAAPQPQPDLPPENVPFRHEGNVYVRRGGQVYQVEDPEQLTKHLETPDEIDIPDEPAQDAPATDPQAVPAEKMSLDIAPQTAQIAVQAIQNAFEENMDPKSFAKNVRGILPDAILTSIKNDGVDNFVDNAVKLPPNSPLLTQSGREYLREVGKFLIS